MKIPIDTDWIKRDYVIAILGSELDEYDVPYVTVYKYELEEFIEDLWADINYSKRLNFSLAEKYNYYRSLLIQSSRMLISDAREIWMDYLDELAFKLAKEVY